ncbi:TIGR02569 family protein [Kribbella sp.]|uniref:TIGR02569 family protein n=1 Tax=Kribbella sp. TaxID=1871183 RepID=UPI002D6C7BF0|nr:TIGR02569 family protein [Kribbella sp.]HZX04632.1 TIGR02569 family protein [Kribbella sp.]
MECPEERVLAAFGVLEPAVRLVGGQGETWRSGDVVLRRADAESAWRAEVLSVLPESDAFRVPRPVRAADGEWVAFGWEASELLAGATDVRRQDDVLVAAAAFHEAVAGLPRPDFIDTRRDPWCDGDRVAWREQKIDGTPPYVELVGPLVDAWRPVDLRAQVVHGDLPGNVMFADGLPPAIIDWPVYWRPTSWAAAVAVADALCWYGAEPGLAARWAHLPEWGQMLIRALIYRMTTDDLAGGAANWTTERRAAYAPVIELALSYSG